MNTPELRAPDLRAEERMVAARAATPPATPPDPKPRRRRGWFRATLGFLFKSALVLTVAGGLAAAGAGYALYRSVAADLPD